MANRISESSTDGTDSAEDEEVTIYEPSDSDEDVQHEALNNMWVTRHLAHSAHPLFIVSLGHAKAASGSHYDCSMPGQHQRWTLSSRCKACGYNEN